MNNLSDKLEQVVNAFKAEMEKTKKEMELAEEEFKKLREANRNDLEYFQKRAEEMIRGMK